MENRDKIIILDFGSQYTQLITRKIRELGVYAEIVPFTKGVDEIIKLKPKGIILSGGPASVYEKNAPLIYSKIFDLQIPVLGICYGMQLIAHLFQGQVKVAYKQEFGYSLLNITNKDALLFKNILNNQQVWMSHNDHITKMPENFEIIAKSQSIAAIKHKNLDIYGVQFHPEVTHSIIGKDILKKLYLWNLQMSN